MSTVCVIILVGAENSISAIAHLYGQTIDPDRIDIETLQKMVDDTPFDYIGIVGADSIYTDNHGKQAQVSDRYYFRDGMAGLSNMSHDMRTPMNAIIGFSTLLDRDALRPDKVREYNRKITASGLHLLDLINAEPFLWKVRRAREAPFGWSWNCDMDRRRRIYSPPISPLSFL